MANRSYLNFDLSIEPERDHYRAHVLQSCAGEGSVDFALPFAPHELEKLILKMGHTRGGSARRGGAFDSEELMAAKEFGTKLFKAVFQGDVYARLLTSLESARSQSQGLRVLLRLPPELAHLPWEYLYNPTPNQFFSVSVETPLVRYLEVTPAVPPLAAQLPLRVLVAIASPSDYALLDVEREWLDLQTGLAPLVARGLVTLDRLEKPSLLELQHQLRRRAYHVFHFIGHGVFDPRKQDGLLIFCDAHGRGNLVSGQKLGTILHDHTTLRLALLNACEGARGSPDDTFAGVAQSLVQMGLPSVIAMQFEINDTTAILFAQEFYNALADGYGVDAALSDARKAIFASGDSVEWGTPVLFSRTLDGQIFDWTALPVQSDPVPPVTTIHPVAPDIPPDNPSVPVGAPPQPLPPAEIARLYEDGLSAFYLEEFQQARDCLRRVLDAHPAYRDAAGRLKQVEQQLDLAQRYQQAQEYLQSAQWQPALALLEALTVEAPNYREAGRLLQQTRQQVHLQALYADAVRQSQSGAWQAVIDSFAQIAKLHADYPDPQNLLVTARERLAEQQRQDSLANDYRAALQALDEQNWGEAAHLLEQIEQAQPGYRAAARLLAKARAEVARQKPPEPARPLWMTQNPPILPAIEALRNAASAAVVTWAAEILAGRDEALRHNIITLLAGLGPEGGLGLVALLTRFLENERESPALRARSAWALSKLAAQPDDALWQALHSARQPANDLLLKSAATWSWCELGRFAELGVVKVPAGKFLMGSDLKKDAEAANNEKPQHSLTLPAFYIAKYPVTVAEWRAYIKTSGRKSGNADSLKRGDHYPVVLVSWREALAYAQWFGLTLPSEAEWEKAARGTDGRIYPWGNKWGEKLTNTDGQFRGTTPVGQFSSGGDSPYHCADMAGNVWEWTRSLLKSYPYNPQDGREDLQSNSSRALRGGAFNRARKDARCAYRGDSPDLRHSLNLGFRVAVVSPIFPL